MRLLDHLFDFDEIRVHSLRPESREAFAAKLSNDLGKPVRATTDWKSCVEGADIVVEASRLPAPKAMLQTKWIGRGAFVVPYGTMSAVEIDLLSNMDKVVVDDWGQCKSGKFGSLRAHVETGLLSESNLHAELCEIVVGKKLGGNPIMRQRCSGIVVCRFLTLRLVTRCLQRLRRWVLARSCVTRENYRWRQTPRTCRFDCVWES